MKIALVHDWLNHKRGGGEQVILEMANMFKNAPIYTLLFDEERFDDVDPSRVRTSYLQRLPAAVRKRPRSLLPLIPSAVESFDFSDFDIVISSSVAFTKNIITDVNTVHITYCHSPMRFAWDYWPRYLDELGYGAVRKSVIRPVMHRIRQWDFSGSARVDYWIANSKTVKQRIKKFYRQDKVTIIHPPVTMSPRAQRNPKDYYVTLANLTPYKKIDTAIDAFEVTGKRLIVIGDGELREQLSSEASENISFVGFVSEEEKWKLLRNSRGLVFPNEEDFGMAAVEAMSAGVPVIGYKKGGLTETVVDGKTGVLYKNDTIQSLNKAVNKAESISFNIPAMRRHATQFNTDNFKQKLATYVKKAYRNYHQ